MIFYIAEAFNFKCNEFYNIEMKYVENKRYSFLAIMDHSETQQGAGLSSSILTYIEHSLTTSRWVNT